MGPDPLELDDAMIVAGQRAASTPLSKNPNPLFTIASFDLRINKQLTSHGYFNTSITRGRTVGAQRAKACQTGLFECTFGFPGATAQGEGETSHFTVITIDYRGQMSPAPTTFMR
jgi:hypothetical protein